MTRRLLPLPRGEGEDAGRLLHTEGGEGVLIIATPPRQVQILFHSSLDFGTTSGSPPSAYGPLPGSILMLRTLGWERSTAIGLGESAIPTFPARSAAATRT